MSQENVEIVRAAFARDDQIVRVQAVAADVDRFPMLASGRLPALDPIAGRSAAAGAAKIERIRDQFPTVTEGNAFWA